MSTPTDMSTEPSHTNPEPQTTQHSSQNSLDTNSQPTNTSEDDVTSTRLSVSPSFSTSRARPKAFSQLQLSQTGTNTPPQSPLSVTLPPPLLDKSTTNPSNDQFNNNNSLDCSIQPNSNNNTANNNYPSSGQHSQFSPNHHTTPSQSLSQTQSTQSQNLISTFTPMSSVSPKNSQNFNFKLDSGPESNPNQPTLSNPQSSSKYPQFHQPTDLYDQQCSTFAPSPISEPENLSSTTSPQYSTEPIISITQSTTQPQSPNLNQLTSPSNHRKSINTSTLNNTSQPQSGVFGAPLCTDNNLTITYHNLSLSFPASQSQLAPPHLFSPLTSLFSSIKRCITCKKDPNMYALAPTSGQIQPKTMTLIISEIGGGKSTLLRLLANRIKPDNTQSILYNGLTIENARNKHNIEVRKLVQYLDQSDHLLPHLTLFETLNFACLVNSVQYAAVRVQKVIKLMGLEESQDVLVANLSGGQRRRLSLCEVLLSDAQCLLLDQFSDGLDSTTTLEITQNLAKWCETENCSVVCTLQQPSPEVVALFSHIIVLHEGHVIFDGKREDLGAFFEAMGMVQPRDVDQVDFITECLVSPELVVQQTQLLQEYEQQLKSHRQPQSTTLSTSLVSSTYDNNDQSSRNNTKSIQTSFGPIIPAQSPCTNNTTMVQYYEASPFYKHNIDTVTPLFQSNEKKHENPTALIPSPIAKQKYSTTRSTSSILPVFRRELIILTRSKAMFIPRFINGIVMAIVYGGLYYQVPQSRFLLRISSLLIGLTQVALSNRVEVPVFFEQYRIVKQQVSKNYYSPFTFIFASFLRSFPMCLLETILFSIILHFMCGHSTNTMSFFVFFFTLLFQSFNISLTFKFIASLSPAVEAAQSFAQTVINFMMVFSGYFISRSSIIKPMVEFYWVSMFSWSTRILAQNEFLSPSYDQLVPYLDPDTQTMLQTRLGDVFLMQSDIFSDPIWILMGFLYLFGFSILIFILHGFLLKSNYYYEGTRGTRRSQGEKVQWNIETEKNIISAQVLDSGGQLFGNDYDDHVNANSDLKNSIYYNNTSYNPNSRTKMGGFSDFRSSPMGMQRGLTMNSNHTLLALQHNNNNNNNNNSDLQSFNSENRSQFSQIHQQHQQPHQNHPNLLTPQLNPSTSLRNSENNTHQQTQLSPSQPPPFNNQLSLQPQDAESNARAFEAQILRDTQLSLIRQFQRQGTLNRLQSQQLQQQLKDASSTYSQGPSPIPSHLIPNHNNNNLGSNHGSEGNSSPQSASPVNNPTNSLILPPQQHNNDNNNNNNENFHQPSTPMNKLNHNNNNNPGVELTNMSTNNNNNNNNDNNLPHPSSSTNPNTTASPTTSQSSPSAAPRPQDPLRILPTLQELIPFSPTWLSFRDITYTITTKGQSSTSINTTTQKVTDSKKELSKLEENATNHENHNINNNNNNTYQRNPNTMKSDSTRARSLSRAGPRSPVPAQLGSVLNSSQPHQPHNNLENETEAHTYDTIHEYNNNNNNTTNNTHNNNANNNLNEPSKNSKNSKPDPSSSFELVNHNNKRVLLDGISGYAQPGKVTGLMGFSGSGKTTLLSALSNRIPANSNSTCLTGQILLNGQSIEKSDLAEITAYVEQFDNLYPYSTVFETLMFVATLKLPKNINEESKRKIVFEVMEILDLVEIQDCIVGSHKVEGLSPAQRKRVALGMELTGNPSIIFLDEPTSGLSSSAALNVMKSIRKIALAGRSVIVTIHQPSSSLFYHLDNLLLLGRGGKQLFFGELGHRSNRFISYLNNCPFVTQIPNIFGQKNDFNDKKTEKRNEKNDAEIGRQINPAAWCLDQTGPFNPYVNTIVNYDQFNGFFPHLLTEFADCFQDFDTGEVLPLPTTPSAVNHFLNRAECILTPELLTEVLCHAYFNSNEWHKTFERLNVLSSIVVDINVDNVKNDVNSPDSPVQTSKRLTGPQNSIKTAQFVTMTNFEKKSQNSTQNPRTTTQQQQQFNYNNNNNSFVSPQPLFPRTHSSSIVITADFDAEPKSSTTHNSTHNNNNSNQNNDSNDKFDPRGSNQQVIQTGGMNPADPSFRRRSSVVLSIRSSTNHSHGDKSSQHNNNNSGTDYGDDHGSAITTTIYGGDNLTTGTNGGGAEGDNSPNNQTTPHNSQGDYDNDDNATQNATTSTIPNKKMNKNHMKRVSITATINNNCRRHNEGQNFRHSLISQQPSHYLNNAQPGQNPLRMSLLSLDPSAFDMNSELQHPTQQPYLQQNQQPPTLQHQNSSQTIQMDLATETDGHGQNSQHHHQNHNTLTTPHIRPLPNYPNQSGENNNQMIPDSPQKQDEAAIQNVENNSSNSISPNSSSQRVSVCTQFTALFKRNHAQYWRNPSFLFVRLVTCLILSLIFGLVYLRPDLSTQTGTISRVASVGVVTFFVSNLHCVSVPVFETRSVFYREKTSGYYSPFLWALCSFLNEMIWIIPGTLLSAICAYFLMDLPLLTLDRVDLTTGEMVTHSTWYLWFFYAITTYLCILCYSSTGLMIASISPTQPLSNILLSAFLGLSFLFSGLTVTIPTVRSGWIWLYRMLPLSHGLEMLLQLFKDDSNLISIFDTETQQTVQIPANVFISGYLGMPFDRYWYQFGWLWLYIVVTQIIAFLGIIFFTFNKR